MPELLFSSKMETARLPDGQMGDAYEATTPERRAWIKTTLALVQAFHPALPSMEEKYTKKPAAGLSFVVSKEVAPWSVLLLGQGCVSSVRLAAAIMNARLAGIEDIVAVCTHKVHDPALLAVLELTGVEHVFALPPEQAATLLTELDSLFRSERAQGAGRLLSFGEPEFEMVRASVPVPVWQDHPPLVGIFPDAADQLEQIAQAHPDSAPQLLTGTDELEWSSFDVVYGTGTTKAPLHLTSDLAGAWLCTDLNPAFFLNCELRVSSTE